MKISKKVCKDVEAILTKKHLDYNSWQLLADELSDNVGQRINRGTISQVARGRRKPSMLILKAIGYEWVPPLPKPRIDWKGRAKVATWAFLALLQSRLNRV